MSVSGGIITGMGKKLGVSSDGDLQVAFGSSQKGQAWFFSTAPIRMGAKYKPFLNTSAVFADMNARNTARANANYGITIPTMTQAEIQAMTGAGWTLHRPDGTSYPRRAQDFEGYYNAAPYAPLYCTAPATIYASTINVNSGSPCAFFVYEKSGQLAYGAPSATAGTVAGSDGRTTAQRNACLELADLKAGSSLITDLTNPYLGIAVFSGTTFKGFAGCTEKLVASQSQTQNDMFITRLSAFTGIAAGTYTGKACVRYGNAVVGYNYVPLPAISGVCYNNFTVKIGGADIYTYAKRGLSTSNTVSSTGTITTNLSTVYVTIRVTNPSILPQQSNASNSGWILVVTITGKVNGLNITPPNRRVSMANYYPGTSTFLTIPANGYTDITFRIDKIWNQDPSGAAAIVSSGNIDIECYLKYNQGGSDTDFTRAPASQQNALKVIYG